MVKNVSEFKKKRGKSSKIWKSLTEMGKNLPKIENDC